MLSPDSRLRSRCRPATAAAAWYAPRSIRSSTAATTVNCRAAAPLHPALLSATIPSVRTCAPEPLSEPINAQSIGCCAVHQRCRWCRGCRRRRWPPGVVSCYQVMLGGPQSSHDPIVDLSAVRARKTPPGETRVLSGGAGREGSPCACGACCATRYRLGVQRRSLRDGGAEGSTSVVHCQAASAC
jgi:hypothetical protein